MFEKYILPINKGFFCHSTVECATLLDINSGYINYETDGWNTKATYQCMNGYSVVGVAERLCNESGSWELTEPTCSKLERQI